MQSLIVYMTIFHFILQQADPSEPERFPFVLLGNKVDTNGGASRAVSIVIRLILSD
ncbi:hypothetical protein Hanom_Chr09g00812051 [Helianthus anomalus]